MPLIIGVTGGIASGKSLVCATLVKLGALHCDVDKLVHRMYEPGTTAYSEILSRYGKEILLKDGLIDRRALGAKVFGRPREMQKLTRAVGGAASEIERVVSKWRADLRPDQCGILEHWSLGLRQRWCDVTWLITCDEDIALRRLMLRNGFSLQEAKQRIASQRTRLKRLPVPDLIIRNNGTVEELEQVVEQEYQCLRSNWSKLEFR